MKFKSLLLVLMFTLTSATWPQAAPSQAPASASSPTPTASACRKETRVRQVARAPVCLTSLSFKIERGEAKRLVRYL
jgi:hypothetical protein